METHIEKVIVLKTLKLSVLYIEGQVVYPPIPQELIKEARHGSNTVRLIEAENLPSVELQNEVQPDEFDRDTEFDEKMFVESWSKLRTSTFEPFVLENLYSFTLLSEDNIKKAIAKWNKFYTKPCPIKEV